MVVYSETAVVVELKAFVVEEGNSACEKNSRGPARSRRSRPGWIARRTSSGLCVDIVWDGWLFVVFCL